MPVRLVATLRVAALSVVLATACSVVDGSETATGGSTVGPPTWGPYIQSVSSSSAVISWVSDEPTAGSVEYDKTQQLGLEQGDDQLSRRHAVTLSDLAPDSTYYYRVTGDDEASEVASFRTAPEGSDSRFSFAVIGDSGDGGAEQQEVAGLLERMKPNLILHTGDVVYPSGEDRNYGPNFFTPYRQLIEGVPVFPVLGNHDVETENGAPYLENFYLPSNNPGRTERYYSFDWGNAHFVALDTELYYTDGDGSPEEQRDWLERDLAATRQPWRFVFFHRPIYSSSKHGSEVKIREDLEPIFDRYGVNIVFSGHDHDYERTVPIEGVTYVVTGGGGSKELYPAGTSEWTALSKSTYHATRVDIDGDHLALEAIEPDDTVIDSLNLAP